MIGSDLAALVSDVGSRAFKACGSGARWQGTRSIAMDAARAGVTPEEAGQLAAREIRRVASLDGAPIPELDPFVREAGLSLVDGGVESRHDLMIVSCRAGGSAVAAVLGSPRTATPWGARFQKARALAHVLLDADRHGTVGAASGPFSQGSRSRRANAFAAELLLPDSALAAKGGNALDAVADEERFRELLEEYGIGARAAAFQLWNHGWLSSADVRDELIDRFASPTS